MKIDDNSQQIKIVGTYLDKPGEADKYVRIMCAVLHNITAKKAFKEVALDFSNMGRVDAQFIVPLLPIISRYRQKEQIDFRLYLPDAEAASKLFIHANWAHFIDPDKYPHISSDSSFKHVPTLQFNNEDEHFEIVNKVLDMVARTLEDVTRDDIKAIEWSLNEITGNVLTHSQSEVGGFASASCLPAYHDGKKVEIIVADAGIGIPKTLGEIRNPEKALEYAITEGVTSNKETNQGNGLYGSYQLAINSKSDFEISSHQGYLLHSPMQGLKLEKNNTPYTGTVVRYIIDCAQKGLLDKFIFKGEPHEPNSVYLDQRSDEDIIIELKSEQYNRLRFSREGATKLRNEIKNHINLLQDDKVIKIDLQGIGVIPSSVVDEIFGKLFLDIGIMNFNSRIKIINAEPMVKELIDRTVMQRLSSNNGGHE